VTLFLPLALPWIAATLLALLDGRRRPVAWTAVAVAGGSVLALAALAGEVATGGAVVVVAGGWPAGVGIAFRADAAGLAFALVSSVLLLAALAHEVLAGVHERTLPALVLFLQAGLTGLFLTADAFNFYVFFEICMVASFVLASYGRREREARAALIFTVANMVGSALFLAGVAGLYRVTGTLDMRQIAERAAAEDPGRVLVVAVALFAAFSLKLGLFPFHFWLPPIYRDAWPTVAAVLSGAVANVGAYGLLRFGVEVLPAQLAMGAPVLVVLGGVSLVYGAHQAVAVRTPAETFAYSAIGQVGYIMVALGVGGGAGVAAAVLYALVNALNKALLFLSIAVRGWPVGAAFAVGAMSVAGVPPAAGFLAKASLFRAVLASDGAVPAAGLAALVALGGALSFVYMFQTYQRRWWREPAPAPASAAPVRALIVVLAALVLALGLWPEPLLALSEGASRALGGAATRSPAP
jgi:multicomponent Na+:H+ antiporter subunit D